MDLLGVVWYAHNTLGNSSTHLSLAPSNLLFNSFHNGFVGSLSLAVALQICQGRLSVCNDKTATKFVESFIVKL